MRSITLVFLVAVVLLHFFPGVTEAVPPRFANFTPQTDSVLYGLVVKKSESEISVLPYSQIVARNEAQFVRARAYFNSSLHEIGWNYLYVIGDKNLLSNPETQSEAYRFAGILEGALTWDHLLAESGSGGDFLLQRSRVNNQQMKKQKKQDQRRPLLNLRRSKTTSDEDDQVVEFVKQQLSWTQQMATENKKASKFWAQTNNFLAQLEGLAHGANLKTSWLYNFTLFDMYFLNLDAELTDIQYKFNPPSEEQKKNPKPPQHCSALVKVLDEDVFSSQVVWSPYEIMYRYFKTYEMQTTVTFSSYPVFVSSADDFYQTSNSLIVTETTNGCPNVKLLQKLTPRSVAEFLRMQVANFLANDGASWTQYYSEYCSGTYNNQQIITDLKKFTPASRSPSGKRELSAGFLWIAEQIPCRVFPLDVTEFINTHSYWPSYNIPYQKRVYNESGFLEQYERFGDWFSYEKAPRAQIFRNLEDSVTDLRSMQHLMRLNEFNTSQTGLIQNCKGCPGNVCNPKFSGMNAVSSRGDLTPHSSGKKKEDTCYGPLSGALGPQQFGALDCKIGSFKNMKSMTIDAVSGPTNVEQPTFQFPKKDLENLLIPRVWDFAWQTFFSP